MRMNLNSRKGIYFYIVAFLLLSFILFIAFYNIKSSYLYNYNVREDYVYDFSNSNDEVIDVNILDDNRVLPEFDDDWNTAILELNVNSTFLGKFFQPRIYFRSETNKTIQYFEHNGKGSRYVDLSSVLKEGGDLTYVVKFLKRINQSAKIYFFNNPEIDNLKVLVLSTHPDDGEIAAYGFYSSVNDSTTNIVTITAGEAGPQTYYELYRNNINHYKKKGQIRVWNSIAIPMLAGISPGNAINLGYFDGKLIDMYKDSSEVSLSRSLQSSGMNQFRKMNISMELIDTNGVSNWTSLVSNITRILYELEPDNILSPYPGLSNHPDHRLTTVALFEAIKKVELRKGSVYLYANDNVLGGNFYPYGKVYSLISLPPSFGNEYYFNSIYCHPLSFNEQNNKLLALEAMNDLRPDTEWRSSIGSIRKTFRTTFKNTFGLDRSYYRRAIRQNELFFIVNIANFYKDKILGEIEDPK